MKTKIKLLLLLLSVSGTVWLTGRQVEGFSYFNYAGIDLVWPDHRSDRYLAPSTFPAGTDISDQMLEAMTLWSIVPGSNFDYYYAHMAEDPVVDHQDGYNDTLAVPAETLDPGVLAVTYMVFHTGLAVWYDMDTEFADYPAEIGWNLEWNPPCWMVSDPATYGVTFLLVATHEMGHALGLGDDPSGGEPPGTPWFIATMNPAYPAGAPVGDNNIIEVHTDDRSGVRYLYPGSESLTDLANSGYCSAGPIIGMAVPAFIDPSTCYPGDQPQAWSVLENFGTTDQTNVGQTFYLSEDETIDAGDLLLGELRWDLVADDAIEFQVQFDLPDLAPGLYFLGSKLDELNEVVEEYEDNNDVLYCDPLAVAQLAPEISPMSQQVVGCDEPFVGPAPLVSYPINMAPITWSLDNPQPGMTMDPGTGVITWPEPIPASFQYELDIRATNAAGSDVETLHLGVQQSAPQIVDIPDHGAPCGQAYSGPTPALTVPACMGPVLDWALVTGPFGMTINSASGAVSWSPTIPSSVPYLVTIRAINAAGESTESWLLSVDSSGGDFDADEDVDLDDYDFMADCISGPGAAVTGACACGDFDGDGDVDLPDNVSLMRAFTGAVIHSGACCYSNGVCGEGAPEDCYDLGGTYMGDGASCATISCSGACCFYTGGCLTFDFDDCNIAGGTFQGMDTDCAELTCPAGGEGACCLPSESCILSTPAECEAQAGAFQGEGWSCEAIDCSESRGACCHGNGTCSEATSLECLVADGTYMGDNTTCAGVTCTGACCYPGGGCLDLSESDCETSGGVFQGTGTICATTTCVVEPLGACCLPDETCTQATETECAGFGGNYFGDDSICAGVDCSSAGAGACCHPNGWACTEETEQNCTAAGGIFEGEGTTCGTTDCPEYRNESTPTGYWAPGAFVSMADDLTLTGTAREMVYYDLAVYGTGGGTYDVIVALYDGCPGEGGTQIADTEATWSAIPADDQMYLLSADLSPYPVTIPDTVWMVTRFSTANSGWVVADEAEAGFTDDLFAQQNPTWMCDLWWGGPPNDYAGFYASIQCLQGPQPEGACCHPDESCTEGTPSACTTAGGLFQGDGTVCATVDCSGVNLGACCNPVSDWSCSETTEPACNAAGGTFEGLTTTCSSIACPEYRNDHIGTYYNPGTNVALADDISPAGNDRTLVYYDLMVYGGGGGTFDVSASLYTGCPGEGGALIPDTTMTWQAVPDDGYAYILSADLSDDPVTIPDTVWMVTTFTTELSGWLLGGQAEVGFTADTFGMDLQPFSCTETFEGDYAGMSTNLQCVAGGRSSSRGKPSVSVVRAEWFGVRTPHRDVSGSSTGVQRGIARPVQLDAGLPEPVPVPRCYAAPLPSGLPGPLEKGNGLKRVDPSRAPGNQ